MSARIAGIGWVTPLGADLETVWSRLMAGDIAESKTLINPESGRIHPYFPVPPKLVDSLARNPRLRRSSAISYFSVAAGLAALENAGLAVTPQTAERTAVVFAISDGGVQYTRRFYEQIVKQGANCASPLLFPETVYNAPASHLSAQLGLNGASYTLAGDGSVGMSALHFGAQLLDTLDIDQCLVVGAEECDWVLCEAYRDWRFAKTPLAEGAAAVVLNRTGRLSIKTHPGIPFFRQARAVDALGKVVADLVKNSGPIEYVVRSANGTFIDQAELEVLNQFGADIGGFSPKAQLGEAPGASALIQTVGAAMALEKQMARSALVSVIGFNQQAGGALLTV
ncbi:MAG: Beta-ketoacyl synthase [Chthoniobacteraceae bacterium]|nr:Beta-ketoacyl synthase [Chthoniobacteraceae bacterium]